MGRSRLGLELLLAASFLVGSARSLLPAQDRTAELRTPPPEGVTPQVELAIVKGLGWLKRTQRPDGSWVGEGGTYPVAMTSLAGMALLGSGSTVTRGPHSAAIRKAAAFLLRAAQSNGLFNAGDGDYEERSMYGQAFAMMFLAQVLGQEESLEKREEIGVALRRAVDLTIRAQSDPGGWYYYPRSDDDEGTLTVTMMQGLRACRDAGVHVPKAVIDRGVRYIEDSANEDGSVNYRSSRSSRNEVRHGVTCASVVALWSAGRYEDPLLKRIVGYIDRNIRPQWGSGGGRYGGRHTTYIQFYLAQAKFLLGGSRWSDFYRQESRLLTGEQNPDGSWLTEEEMRQHGVGAIYSSSIALIVLQLPYNRLPIFQR